MTGSGKCGQPWAASTRSEVSIPSIERAAAIANNEVAYLAWSTEPEVIPGCLGFHIVREVLGSDGSVAEERPLASYVAFEGQRNPDWQPQNTTVWPVQKYGWRDLTLRRRRDRAKLRPENETVRYRIRAVGAMRSGLEPVNTVASSHRGRDGQVVEHAYEGTPLPLGYLTRAALTNAVTATIHRPPFQTTFTNGILSTQFLLKVLSEDGAIQSGELEGHLRKPGDWLRRYLSGDVITVIQAFFAQAGGRFHAALYELEDEELESLLAANAERLSLILSDAGSLTPRKHGAGGEDQADGPAASDREDAPADGTVYDARNAKARAALRALADKPGTRFEMQDRLFNGSGHIGHNKFVVFVDAAGTPRSVLTGSTNWTWSGVAGQSNNCIRIDDAAVAAAYLAYWEALRRDEQPVPDPPGSRAVGAVQGDGLKRANRSPVPPVTVGGATMEVWFSPNVPGKSQPPPARAKKPSPPPPDMDRLFSLVRRARQAIFFLVFMPSRGGLNSIVSEAIALGLKDTSLTVIGAVSDTQAMWGYEASHEDGDGRKVPAWSPHTFAQAGVSVVRATALTDKEIGRQLGDFQIDEKLTVGRAIIHDKVVVIDPLDPDGCAVAFGSHNLGYKASYANDENLMIVRGHRPLAEAYTAHVLDVYDHYRFRAVEAERAEGRDLGEARWDGFLKTDGSWQASTSRRLSDYLTG